MNYYLRYVKTLIQSDNASSPRGLPTRCKYDISFTIPTGVTFRRLHDNPLIGFMEGLQFISGTGDVSEISKIAPKADLKLFSGQSLYGPRVGLQAANVIQELLKDPASRRAVIVLADKDEPLESRPCTTSLQFQITKNGMLTIVTMRSSDAVYGLPYDLIQFSMMSQMIAACVGAKAFWTVINIGNAHIYDATAHLAVNYAPWSFSLPSVGNDYSAWVEWAKDEIPLLSMDRAKEAYAFRKSPEVTKIWTS